MVLRSGRGHALKLANGRKGFFDLMLLNKEETAGILLELKVVRVNAVAVAPLVAAVAGEDSDYISPAVDRYFESLSDDEKLDLEILPSCRHWYKQCETVREVVELAKLQVRRYHQALYPLTLRAFVVMLVGTRSYAVECT